MATGLGLAALSLTHLLVSTVPLVWGGEGGRGVPGAGGGEAASRADQP